MTLTAEPYERTDPDVALMLRVRDDDAEAFEELVKRYQSRLLTVMIHLVGQRDAADDLTQEVFLRVFSARRSYRPDARFTTWLYTIAHNVVHNWRRKRARQREVQVGGTTGDSHAAVGLSQLAVAGSGQMPTRGLDRREMSEIVRAAVESLGERQRLAILLSKFEQMSYVDIAKTMGLSVPAVKSLLTRARLNLKEMLAPYYDRGGRPVGVAAGEDGDGASWNEPD